MEHKLSVVKVAPITTVAIDVDTHGTLALDDIDIEPAPASKSRWPKNVNLAEFLFASTGFDWSRMPGRLVFHQALETTEGIVPLKRDAVEVLARIV